MKRAKKILSILLAVTMLISVIVTFPASVNAASASDIKAALDAKMQSSTFKPGNTPPSSQYRSGTSGCYGFVDLLYRQIFGHTLPSIKKVETSVGTQKMELVASTNFTQIGTTLSNKAGNLNSSNLSNLFSKAQVGDVVQMDYTTYDNADSLHTMIVYSVSSSGVVLYHAGSSKIYFGASSGTQPLWGTTGSVLTWSKLLDRLGSSDDGISIYRSNSSSVNIDTNTNNNTNSYSSTNPDDYTYPTSTIYRTSPTMKGSTVAWVQAVLYQLGYSIEIDGSYGANSETVVKQFQSANGLEVDGRVGPATRAKLLELWNAKKAADTHTCNQYSYCIDNEHPHYTYYKCSVCGKVTSEKKESKFPECDICYPPIANVWMNCSKTELKPGDSNTFTFGADNAETYHIGVDKDGVRILTQKVESGFSVTFLEAGSYSAYVTCAAKNRTSVDSNKVYFEVVEQITTLPSIDGHSHNYYSIEFCPSSCTEYGYTVYACDCGDNYKKYETELEEHHILSRYDVIESSADNVGFIGDYCYRCSYINNCKVVYPDGTEKSVYLSKDSDGYNSLKEIIGIYKELLLEIDLKASLSTDDERTIDFSWSTVDEVKATDDEAISTEDEISYYELSIYKDNELVETIRTVTPNCVWMFGSDYYFTVVISAFNSDGDILAISSVFAVDVDTICVDYFDCYGNVDRKGDINVKDATLIQKYLANLVELEKYPLRLADVNSDGKVNIKDATAIQKYCAKIDVDSRIGNECWDGYVEYSGVRVELAR